MTTDQTKEIGGPIVVAIDGPAGSGKSSVSRAAARVLGYSYQDTGAAYRGFALYCLQHATDLAEADLVAAALADFEYEIGIDPDNYWVHVGGVDVTDEIREPWVSAAVSSVARIPAVRQYMVDLFRSIIETSFWPGILVEG
ncbi:MAG TPA: (d)CMP kinase, partial [Galbitalea sp.]